jgi:ketosteroid isomerase-like protein
VDNVLGFFMKLMEATGGTFKVELHDVLASDEHVVALAKSSGTRNGKTLIADYAHVCHMKDGKLTEAWIINVDPYAGDEFLS